METNIILYFIICLWTFIIYLGILNFNNNSVFVQKVFLVAQQLLRPPLPPHIVNLCYLLLTKKADEI